MKQNKYIHAMIEVFILGTVILLAFTALNSQYLFGWAAHNWKFYLVLSSIPLILFLLNKQIVSVLMTIGIALGIFAGNYLGAMLRNHNIGKIIKGMAAEEAARLHLNQGFIIWISIIILFIIIGVIMQASIKKKELNI